MHNNTKYWYLRFKDNFFNETWINEIKLIPDIGYQMIVTLLELFQLSVPNKGIIIISDFYISQNTVDNFSVEKDEFKRLCEYLSFMIREPERIIGTTLKYAFEKKLMIIDRDCEGNIEITIPYVVNNTSGKAVTVDADRKRIERQENKKLKENNTKKLKLGIFENVFLTEQEYEEIVKNRKKADVYINRLSIEIKQNNYLNNYNHCKLIKLLIDGKPLPIETTLIEK